MKPPKNKIPDFLSSRFRVASCDIHKAFLRPVSDGNLVTEKHSARVPLGVRRRSRKLRLSGSAPTARACAVSCLGISFPPLTLGSQTPNLSPRSCSRRGARPARGAPAHVPTHAPAYGGGQGSRAGGRPARAEQPGESALFFPPSPHSPPRSLPPSPRMFRYEVSGCDRK